MSLFRDQEAGGLNPLALQPEGLGILSDRSTVAENVASSGSEGLGTASMTEGIHQNLAITYNRPRTPLKAGLGIMSPLL
jgi:hypothetical protein